MDKLKNENNCKIMMKRVGKEVEDYDKSKIDPRLFDYIKEEKLSWIEHDKSLISFKDETIEAIKNRKIKSYKIIISWIMYDFIISGEGDIDWGVVSDVFMLDNFVYPNGIGTEYIVGTILFENGEVMGREHYPGGSECWKDLL